MSETTLLAPDALAGERLLATRPQWSGISNVGEVTGHRALLLHAGPPFESWHEVPKPVRNSLALACLIEGWAANPDEALSRLKSGQFELAAAQDHDIVVPLAGVASPSMAVHVVNDAASDRVKYSVLNEGMQHCLRLGALDPQIPAHHTWLNGAYAEWLRGASDAPIPLLPLLGESLRAGDDGHSRTSAGSELFAQRLINGDTPPDIATFLHGCKAFALNLWMGAAALILGAAEGIPGSTAVTRAGGNGTTFGIQVASRPGHWRTVPGTPPLGPVDPAHQGQGAVGAIGDSAVVDMLGLGGQSVASAPTVRQSLAGFLPGDALDRPAVLLPLELQDAGGLRTGLCASTVAQHEIAPLVLLGMISDAGHGRIGGGVYEPPLSLFTSLGP